MKTCSKCRASKPDADFHYKPVNRLDCYCKPCRSAVGKEHYRLNRQAYLARSRAQNSSAWTAATRASYDQLKDAPCTDCGGRFPACAMDWDHLPGAPKRCGVGDLKLAPKKLREDLKNCELVCANCRRVRTQERLTAARDTVQRPSGAR